MKNLQRILELSREAEKEHPPTVCTYRSAFFRCTREKYKNEDFCFWHVRDEKKFNAEYCAEYFQGKHDQETIKIALEVEIRESRSLEGAFLYGLNLTHQRPNFEGGNFRDANMHGFHFGYGSVKDCCFIGADLVNSNLCDCDLTNTDFNHARLHNAKFRDNDFTLTSGINKESFFGFTYTIFPSYRINELKTTEGVCADTYRKLKLLFNAAGRFDDASWAAYKEKVMERKVLYSQLRALRLYIISLYTNGNISTFQRVRISLAQSFINRIRYFLSHFYSISFGYGERPMRVILLSLTTIFGYAWFYYWFNALTDSDGNLAGKYVDALYFSVVTFTTLGPGDLTPASEWRLFVASEALLGAFLVGLFLFTLARRAVGRA